MYGQTLGVKFTLNSYQFVQKKNRFLSSNEGMVIGKSKLNVPFDSLILVRTLLPSNNCVLK